MLSFRQLASYYRAGWPSGPYGTVLRGQVTVKVSEACAMSLLPDNSNCLKPAMLRTEGFCTASVSFCPRGSCAGVTADWAVCSGPPEPPSPTLVSEVLLEQAELIRS